MYLQGKGVAKDYASAKRWYEKAGDAGHSLGYGWIGGLYEQGGPGLKKDLVQACHYYQKGGFAWQADAEKVCSH